MDDVTYELTNAQKNILLIEQFYSGTQINNICGTSILRQNINFDNLKRAINILIKNNDIFQLRFKLENNTTYQYLTDYEEIDIEIVDIPNESYISKLEDELQKKVYNIYSGEKIFDCKIFKLENNYGGFIFNVHHLIGDSWSLGLISKRTTEIYNMLESNLTLEEAYPSYINYINDEKNYLNSEKYLKDEQYWNSVFSSIPEIAIIPSKNNKANNELNCCGRRSTYIIPQEVIHNISALCGKNKISIYNFFMAIYSIYIGKICGCNNFVIGTPVLNRCNITQKNTMGMFISTLPFKINLEKNQNFIEFAKKISLDSFSMLKHQKYPYENILKKLREKNLSLPNLYSVLLSYQITTATANKQINETRWAFNKNCADDIQIHILDLNDCGNINICYDYQTQKFESTEIDNLHKRILNIINQVLKEPNIELNKLNLITENESNFIENSLNKTKVNLRKSTVLKVFENIASATPDKIAIICNDDCLTYRQLNEKSNQLAYHLLENNIMEKDLVAVMTSRSLEMVISILAILKIGGTYIPIDPTYPEERVLYLIENSKASAILVDDKTSGNIENVHKINVSLKNEFYNNYLNASNLNIIVRPNNLMYVIYTSGLTGNPKGVMISHENVYNFLIGVSNIINFKNDSNILSLTTICFDIFVLELFGGLINGLSVIIANENEQNNTLLLNKLCLKYNVQMLQTTPSRISFLLKDEKNLEFLKNISCIMLGGETLQPAVIKNIQQFTNGKIFNMYGPTETTIWSTIKQIDNSEDISIGKPIANTSCYIFNSDLKLLPPYTPGILYIGGKGVSKGYYNSPELTLERFIPNPLKEDEIIYNTGDLAYYNELGEIYHLGRNDFQIKLRGYRIELGEIENKILSYPNILENSVIADNNFLVCYYTSNKKIDEANLISYLLKRLPSYMVPSDFIKLDKMPLTPNGKLDRKSLTKIAKSKLSIELPETNTEKLLTQIINNITGKEITNINSSFISLGLDSLGIIEAQTTLLSHNINLTTHHFYKYPNIKKLSEFIDNNSCVYNEKHAEIPDKFKHYPDELLSKISHLNKNENILRNVFLTGSNGFIGSHILHELITTTENKIYCLVRGKDEEFRYKKLNDSFKYYFKYDLTPLINKRIFIISGDISYENLNLSIENYEMLKNTIDTIINAAAVVKHYGDILDFEKNNINGTKNVAEFALNNNIRLIHLSSISVSGNYLVKQDNRNIEFSENNLYIGQHYEDNNYVYSKMESEKLILKYMQQGLTAQIARIGIVAGRFSDGVFQNNIQDNAFYSRIKSIINMHAVLDKMSLEEIEFTPVDLCTKAIITLAKNSIANNKVFNIYNHNLITISKVVEALEKMNIDIKILNSQEFNNHILELSKTNQDFIKGIINDLNYDSKNLLTINYNFTVNIQSKYTRNYLHLLNFDWPILNDEYLVKLLKHMKDVNFI